MPAEHRGLIFDIERFAIYDGPGIRSTVFLKGCPLRCAWCQNPEGMNARPEVMYHERLCTLCGGCETACPRGAHEVSAGGHIFHRELCAACGDCAEACPAEALELAGREMTVEAVMDIALRDRVFYEASGGGLTLSGGEALMQPEFAFALLSAAKAAGLHTALDTCGSVPWGALEAALALVDLFLYDIKDTDEERHRKFTGAPLAPVLENLRRLDAAGARIIVRAPVVPGVNDEPRHHERLEEIARSHKGVQAVERLPCHSLGLAKWRALGRSAEVREFPPNR